MVNYQRLNREFFNRHVVEVARDLLGKVLVFGEHKGIITETEAYRGCEDAASHAFRGITKRTKVMFGKPGISYVYFIYGMYHCLNIVAEPEGHPSGVLLRGVRLLEKPDIHLNGPGKLCRQFGINLSHNDLDLILHDAFYVEDRDAATQCLVTPRIGISKDIDRLWRFVLVE